MRESESFLGFESSTIEVKPRKTAHSDLYYASPAPVEGKAFSALQAIPKAYLEARAQHAIDQLVNRIETATKLHHRKKHDPVMANINQLHDEILEAIGQIPTPEIKTKEELRVFCDRIAEAVQKFKSDRQRNLDVGQKVSEIFFQIERDALGVLFRLSPETDAPKTTSTEELVVTGDQIAEAPATSSEVDLLIKTARADMAPVVEVLTSSVPAAAVSSSTAVPLAGLNKSIATPLMSPAVKAEVDELEAINQKLENFIAIREKLEVIFQVLEKEKISFDSAYDYLINNYAGLGALLKSFPTIESLEVLPQTVKQACFQEYEKYQKALLTVADVFVLCTEFEELAKGIDQSLSPERVAAAHRYFEGSMSFKNRSELKPGLEKLQRLQPLLELVLPALISLVETTAVFRDYQLVLNGCAEIRFLSKQIVTLLPSGNDEKITQIFKQASTKDAIDSAQNISEKTGESTREKRFSWQKATPEEAKNEAKRRILNAPHLAVLNYLIDNQRWNDLRRVCDLLAGKDLTLAGLNASCFGLDTSIFKTKEAVLTACFPEAYVQQMTVSEELTAPSVEGGRSGKKFHWGKKGITREEIHNEVKARLFHGWPLIEVMVAEQNWSCLRQVLEKLTASALVSDFRINASCVAQENAPFQTKEAMFEEVFPLAYPQENSIL